MDCDVSPATHARRHRSRRRNRLKQTPNQRQPSRSRNASYVGQRVSRSCGLRAGVRLTLQGSPANRSLSAIEPVSAPPKGKLKNGDQRPAPKTRPARTEIRKITDQRLGSTRVTRGNVGDSPQRGNKTPETGLPGWGGRIRTSAWRNQNPLPYRLATPQCRFLSQAAARGGRTLVRGRTSRNRCWRDKATIATSFSSVRTVDRTSFGPIGASLAKLRFFHLATAFGLIPYCSASSCRLF